MMHMDIGTTNAIIAAKQENVARMLKEGYQRGPVMIWLGSQLIRFGEWLRRDVEMPRRPEGSMGTGTRRPQVA
jgi:hypothetical protein